MTGRDLVTDAFYEVNILGAGEVLEAEDLEFGLGKLNRIVNNWNAKREAVWCDVFSPFVLTPALSPHTIGPTGTWVVAQRPVTIENMSLLVGTVKIPITMHDREWYENLPIPSMANLYPLDCFYEKDWPNGKLFFYPVPSSAYTVVLSIRTLLTDFAESVAYSLPPGYQDALTLTLSESLGSAYPGAVITKDVKDRAKQARAQIFSNNLETPRISTQDAGMPGGRSGGEGTYLTGWWPRR